MATTPLSSLASIAAAARTPVIRVSVGNRVADYKPDEVGVFGRMQIEPRQPIQIAVAWPETTAGERIVAAVEDGGQLAERERVQVLSFDAERLARFQFTAPAAPGLCRVTLRRGSETKIVEFWAGPRLPLAVR